MFFSHKAAKFTKELKIANTFFMFLAPWCETKKTSLPVNAANKQKLGDALPRLCCQRAALIVFFCKKGIMFLFARGHVLFEA
jgi:hypothetical protein